MTFIAGLFLAQEEGGTAVEHLSPSLQELIVGAIAFAILFVFLAKWVLPRLNTMLEERRQRIQGELERAEKARQEADRVLVEYRDRLGGAREESNRIIEEARRTADQMQKDLRTRAEQEAQAIVARAQDEIRAERDRVFQELRGQVGVLSVELAARVVGESLDKERQLRLVDGYIDEIGSMAPSGNGGPTTGSER